jgi:hypothetical protein
MVFGGWVWNDSVGQEGNMEVLLDGVAAAKWLTEHGVHRTAQTLRKLRCLGGGPSYRSLNGRAYYTANDLVAWIEERLSEPRR